MSFCFYAKCSHWVAVVSPQLLLFWPLLLSLLYFSSFFPLQYNFSLLIFSSIYSLPHAVSLVFLASLLFLLTHFDTAIVSFSPCCFAPRRHAHLLLFLLQCSCQQTQPTRCWSDCGGPTPFWRRWNWVTSRESAVRRSAPMRRPGKPLRTTRRRWEENNFLGLICFIYVSFVTGGLLPVLKKNCIKTAQTFASLRPKMLFVNDGIATTFTTCMMCHLYFDPFLSVSFLASVFIPSYYSLHFRHFLPNL